MTDEDKPIEHELIRTGTSDGTVLVEAVNRGEAALRWVDRLKGKKYLQAVE